MSGLKEAEEEAAQIAQSQCCCKLKTESSAGVLGVRHVQAVLLFFGMCTAFALRVNLSVGMVAMVSNSTNKESEIIDWSPAQRGVLFGSFFWGSVLTQIPAGLLATKIGASKPLGITMIINGISTLLFPAIAVYGGFPAACSIRAVQGLGQGFLFPCINTLLAKWAVPEERGRLCSFIFGGAQFGTIVMLPAGGFIAANAGWPSIFYVSGAAGIISGVLCLRYVVDTPEKHTTISKKERLYIESHLISNASSSTNLKIPWSEITQSVPLWALLTVHMAQNWVFWTLLGLMPSYINGVFHFDIQKNGYLSALPFLAMWLTAFVFSFIADFLIKKNVFTYGTSRKFWNSLALYGGAIALTMLSFLDVGPTGAIALLTTTCGLTSAVYNGCLINHIDLSPNFAGTLMGITNGLSSLCSIFGPTVGGIIVSQQDNVAQWRTVFLIAAVVSVFGQTVFNIFGSAELQRWNKGAASKKNVKDSEEGALYHKIIPK